MKISLIIPAYNEEKYLARCLRSIRKHAAGLHEIILVNNASSDATSQIAASFPEVTVIEEPLKGLTRARNKGLQKARGDIVAYIDADNEMSPGWLVKLSENFEKDKELICLSGPCLFYDEPRGVKLLVWVYWIVFVYPVYFLVGYLVIGGNFAVRKEVLHQIGGFDNNIAFHGEDTNLARRLSKIGKVKFKLNFYMFTSARRMRGEGIIATGVKYIRNFASEVFLQKPADREYKDVR